MAPVVNVMLLGVVTKELPSKCRQCVVVGRALASAAVVAGPAAGHSQHVVAQLLCGAGMGQAFKSTNVQQRLAADRQRAFMVGRALDGAVARRRRLKPSVGRTAGSPALSGTARRRR